MSRNDDKTPQEPEIESLNEAILNPDEVSLEELEQVSGGLSDCGSNCGVNCGTYSPKEEEQLQ